MRILLILLFVLNLLLALVIVSTAIADTVTINRIAGYYTGNGGEFTLYPSTGLQWVLGSYAPGKTSNIAVSTGTAPSFQSFCVEIDEYVNTPGGPYNAVINNQAIAGGKNTNSGDPLSVGSAWLYYMFATGQLPNYNYTPGSTPEDDRHEDARKLQTTIWWLEDEQSDPGAGNEFRNLVLNQFGNVLNNVKTNNNGQYPVAVLNLYDLSGGLKQDQLVLVPEPTTMLLLGSGLIGLVGAARRMFKKQALTL